MITLWVKDFYAIDLANRKYGRVLKASYLQSRQLPIVGVYRVCVQGTPQICH